MTETDHDQAHHDARSAAARRGWEQRRRRDLARRAWDTRMRNERRRDGLEEVARISRRQRRALHLADVVALLRAARTEPEGAAGLERWALLDLVAAGLEEIGRLRGEVAELGAALTGKALISEQPPGRITLVAAGSVRHELRRGALELEAQEAAGERPAPCERSEDTVATKPIPPEVRAHLEEADAIAIARTVTTLRQAVDAVNGLQAEQVHRFHRAGGLGVTAIRPVAAWSPCLVAHLEDAVVAAEGLVTELEADMARLSPPDETDRSFDTVPEEVGDGR